jgi:hypothetical protein
MLKKVALIELSRHNEVLHAYIDMFTRLNCEIDCYTNSFCFDQINLIENFENINWNIIKSQNYYNELERIELVYDNIIFITLDPIINSIPKKFFTNKSTLVIHDINAYTKPKKHISILRNTFIESLKNLMKYGTYILLDKEKKIKNLLDSACNYAFPTEETKSYFAASTQNKIKTYVLNFAVPKHDIKIHDRPYVNITIPGNISNKNRDYNLLLKAIQLLKPSFPVNFYFLGNCQSNYAKKIIALTKKINNPLIKLYFYEDFIEQDKFDEQLENSDFLILPFSETMLYQIFKEKMGYSCVSGSINDMAKFYIPSLLPEFYPLENELNNITERYKSAEDLAVLLDNWLRDKKYNTIKKENSSTQYLKKVEHNFTTFLNA